MKTVRDSRNFCVKSRLQHQISYNIPPLIIPGGGGPLIAGGPIGPPRPIGIPGGIPITHDISIISRYNTFHKYETASKVNVTNENYSHI
jgi:hypothetical protein